LCGYTFAEIAALRGSSERTVQRDWHKARSCSTVPSPTMARVRRRY